MPREGKNTSDILSQAAGRMDLLGHDLGTMVEEAVFWGKIRIQFGPC